MTPVDAGVARPLIEGLSTETVVTDASGAQPFDVDPKPFRRNRAQGAARIRRPVRRSLVSGGRVHVLERSQRLELPAERAFEFYAEAHTHTFHPVAERAVVIGDRVRHALPLGRLAHAVFVRRDLERIVDHRMRAVAQRLASPPVRIDPR